MKPLVGLHISDLPVNLDTVLSLAGRDKFPQEWCRVAGLPYKAVRISRKTYVKQRKLFVKPECLPAPPLSVSFYLFCADHLCKQHFIRDTKTQRKGHCLFLLINSFFFFNGIHSLDGLFVDQVQLVLVQEANVPRSNRVHSRGVERISLVNILLDN